MDEDLGPIVGMMMAMMMLAMFTQPAESGEPATLSGNVTDSEGSPIEGIQLAITSEITEYTTGVDGYYEFTDLLPSTIHLSVVNAGDLGYEPIPLIPITLTAGGNIRDVVLAGAGAPPTPPEDEWTEGVIVREILVTPSVAYVGEIVNIDVCIEYTYPLPLPADIVGKVTVNGTELTGAWTIDFRNPRLRFQYTTITPGDFTVIAQDKIATFTVLEDIVSTYYSPWGGVRMPICTEITIPNVPPFEGWGKSFAGGDYKVKGHSSFWVDTRIPALRDRISSAYPSAWSPAGASVEEWVSYIREQAYWFAGGYAVVVMATEYTCQEYWNNKEELTEMLARAIGGIGIRIPNEWVLEYGTTCPTCGGSGEAVWFGSLRECRTCRGLGKILNVNLRLGWRDWVKSIRYSSVCGGGYCTPRIYCPYCDQRLEGPRHIRALSWDKVSFMRSILAHIETAHPNHPLTEPAWF